jgi:hypothetical protein
MAVPRSAPPRGRQPAHDLHGVVMVAVSANGDALDAGGAARKECRLPATQPVLVEGLRVRRRRVIDDGHQAVNVAVGRSRCGQAQTTHHGRANTVHGQHFPLACRSRDRICQYGRVLPRVPNRDGHDAKRIPRTHTRPVWRLSNPAWRMLGARSQADRSHPSQLDNAAWVHDACISVPNHADVYAEIGSETWRMPTV